LYQLKFTHLFLFSFLFSTGSITSRCSLVVIFSLGLHLPVLFANPGVVRMLQQNWDALTGFWFSEHGNLLL
jgi:hypothetical protein